MKFTALFIALLSTALSQRPEDKCYLPINLSRTCKINYFFDSPSNMADINKTCIDFFNSDACVVDYIKGCVVGGERNKNRIIVSVSPALALGWKVCKNQQSKEDFHISSTH